MVRGREPYAPPRALPPVCCCTVRGTARRGAGRSAPCPLSTSEPRISSVVMYVRAAAAAAVVVVYQVLVIFLTPLSRNVTTVWIKY